ncbi:MAG: alpha/beta hydrolase [Clostridiales bacterium]|nr:alpha/beta hydrolase [Clostridiales bacterium]
MRFLKCFTAVALSVLIFASSFLCLNSFAVSVNAGEKYPYIHVEGVMTSKIYYDKEDENSKTCFPPQTDVIMQAAKVLVPALIKVGFTKNYFRFADSLIKAVDIAFAPLALDNGGNVVNSTGARTVYPSPEKIKSGERLDFDYDWRLDPFTTASLLHDFVSYVKRTAGVQKVVVDAHSFGGVVLLAYCEQYGTDDFQSVMFNATAANGIEFIGDLCERKISFEHTALTEYLKAAVTGSRYEKLLKGVFTFLDKTGVTGRLCGLLTKTFEKCGDRIFRELVFPVFGNWVSVWSMVPNERFESSVRAVFEDLYKNDGVDHSEILEKIQYFQEKIGSRRNELFGRYNDNCNLYIVCRYGFPLLFCTPSWVNQSDMVIDVKYSSCGANTADYGSVLKNEYIADINPRFISPDRTVDASTCFFPEKTWFIKDFVHMTTTPGNSFVRKLLYYDGQATVNTFEDFPRFLVYTSQGAKPDTQRY